MNKFSFKEFIMTYGVFGVLSFHAFCSMIEISRGQTELAIKSLVWSVIFLLIQFIYFKINQYKNHKSVDYSAVSKITLDSLEEDSKDLALTKVFKKL